MTKEYTHNFKLHDVDNDNLLKPKKITTNPRAILDAIGLEDGDVVADFGSGVGFFVIDAAEIVGDNGKIIAIDINPEVMKSVKEASMNSGLKNIYGLVANLEKPQSTKMENESADVVLIINTLYLIHDKVAVLEEAVRILKKGGKLAIMEWLDNTTHTMIDKDQIISPKKLRSMVKPLGFDLQAVFEAGLSHEVTVFRKN